MPNVTARRWISRHDWIADEIWDVVGEVRAGKRCGAMDWAAEGVRALSADPDMFGGLWRIVSWEERGSNWGTCNAISMLELRIV